MSHPLQWTAPQPYWRTGSAASARPGLVTQPQILRFATDDFIEQLLSTLAHDPASRHWAHWAIISSPCRWSAL